MKQKLYFFVPKNERINEKIAIKELEKWKDSPRRKPLIIEGDRQVGKTWLVKEFASSHYRNMVYVNFEKQIYLRNIFKTDFDIDRILTALKAATPSRNR